MALALPDYRSAVSKRNGHAGTGIPACLKTIFIVAYCGVPHVSADVNGRWVKQFLAGKYRPEWGEIVACTKNFIDSLREHNYKGASELMNQETLIRMKMTPDVLDDMGKKLAEAATRNQCGARFTGAGGGGCVWAIGEKDDIEQLKSIWQDILREREDACLLEPQINSTGLMVYRIKIIILGKGKSICFFRM